MSKFIHVDGDDGRIRVASRQQDWGIGWVYEVPDDFEIVIPLEKLEDHLYVYELSQD